ncbi:MAG: phosphopantetheine-binding protein, partial [Acidobacteriota bacterium]
YYGGLPTGEIHEVGEPAFDSGESARWRADGTLELVRSREGQVFLDGFRIDTRTIARALAAHPALADAAVVLRDDDVGEPRLVAYIVVKPGEAPTLTELRGALRRSLPARMIPRAFIEVDSLREVAADNRRRQEGVSGAGECVEPRTATEQVVARLWKDALKVDRVSVHDNFFDLGGYSLLCFQVLERVQRETGQRLSPRVLLLDTLQQVAAQLDRASQSALSR